MGNPMNYIFALCAAAFFITYAVLLFLLGDITVQVAVLVGLLFAAMSQFLAQDWRAKMQTVSSAFAWAGIAFAVIALILLVTV